MQPSMQPETSEVQSFRPLLAQAAARFYSCRAAELEASGLSLIHI